MTVSDLGGAGNHRFALSVLPGENRVRMDRFHSMVRKTYAVLHCPTP